MARVLVTDGGERSALAVVRSLGQADHVVTVVGASPTAIAGASRYASNFYQLPDPLTNAERYVRALEQVVRKQGADVLLPISEKSLRVILSRKNDVSDVIIPFPDASNFERVSDKTVALSTASEIGISVPSQTILPEKTDGPLDGCRGISFPVVVKPHRSVVGSSDGSIEVGVSYADDGEQLHRCLSQVPDSAYPVMIQERIVGPGCGIFLLIWNGEVLAEFAHRRIREKPPSGGVSVYRESVPADEELTDQARALLKKFNWHGVGMVEFKLRRETGEAYLMEINGRFWGSLQLAIDAGVDFPRLLVDAALGNEPQPTKIYQTGVRSRWLWGDVDHLLARIRNPAEYVDYRNGNASRLRAVLDFFRFSPSDCLEVLRLSDPRPFIVESVSWIKDAIGRARFSED